MYLVVVIWVAGLLPRPLEPFCSPTAVVAALQTSYGRYSVVGGLMAFVSVFLLTPPRAFEQTTEWRSDCN